MVLNSTTLTPVWRQPLITTLHTMRARVFILLVLVLVIWIVNGHEAHSGWIVAPHKTSLVPSSIIINVNDTTKNDYRHIRSDWWTHSKTEILNQSAIVNGVTKWFLESSVSLHLISLLNVSDVRNPCWPALREPQCGTRFNNSATPLPNIHNYKSNFESISLLVNSNAPNSYFGSVPCDVILDGESIVHGRYTNLIVNGTQCESSDEGGNKGGNKKSPLGGVFWLKRAFLLFLFHYHAARLFSGTVFVALGLWLIVSYGTYFGGITRWGAIGMVLFTIGSVLLWSPLPWSCESCITF